MFGLQVQTHQTAAPCLYSVQFSSKDFVPPMNCRWDGPDWCAHTILCFIGLCLLTHTLYKASHTFIQFIVIMSLAAGRWHSILNIQFICRQFLCPKLHPVVTVDFQVRPASGQMIMFPQFCVTFFRLYGGIQEVKTENLTCMQIKGRSEKTYDNALRQKIEMFLINCSSCLAYFE